LNSNLNATFENKGTTICSTSNQTLKHTRFHNILFPMLIYLYYYLGQPNIYAGFYAKFLKVQIFSDF
jgi:hypothetical protein